MIALGRYCYYVHKNTGKKAGATIYFWIALICCLMADACDRIKGFFSTKKEVSSETK